jgi:hypothetical protein
MIQYAHFIHRQKKDFSFDSICPRCFLTAASCQTEDGLAAMEIDHTCHVSQGDLLRAPKKLPAKAETLH